MKIHRICLNGFRNYDYQWADFAPGINVINVGSAIARAENPAAMLDELAKEAEKKGVAL